jgi:cellulose synthase/poly-beta-1,6-N-acetylglucosamine synthase-like glycosyltransferase
MLILDIILITIFAILSIYTIRHYIFYWNRLFVRQKRCFQDLAGSWLPSVSILVPMHNEEIVAENCLKRLIEMDYPKFNGHYEIIVIDDYSTDKTAEIVDAIAEKHHFVKVLHRDEAGGHGKGEALKVGTLLAKNDVILIFDADYQPSRNVVKRLVSPFQDPEIGLVMGRVVPINSPQSFLTRIIDIERSGGYQVDQQARYNLGLIPQYGGTVGGIRRHVLTSVGGWDVTKLAEDTDITYRVYLGGWKVGYINIAECFEEGVPTWIERRRQLRRWAIGHNQCLFTHFWPTIKSPVLTWTQKVDGILLLGVYVVPLLMLIGWFVGVYVYLFEQYWWWILFMALLFTLSYNSIGNFAIFNEVGIGIMLDKRGRAAYLLPLNLFNFFANIWVCSGAFVRSLIIHRNYGESPPTEKTNSHTTKNGNGNGGIRWDKTPRNRHSTAYHNRYNEPEDRTPGGF